MFDFGAANQTVNVNNLDGNIAPTGPGVAVDLQTTGTLDVDLDLNDRIEIFDAINSELRVDRSIGIILQSGGDLNVEVDGDVLSSDNGVELSSTNGSVNAIFNGDILGNNDGSFAVDPAFTTVVSSPPLVAQEDGLDIVADTGIDLSIKGNVEAIGDAIEIVNNTGDINIDIEGNIRSGNDLIPFDGDLITAGGESGITLEIVDSANVNLNIVGDIFAYEEGIEIRDQTGSGTTPKNVRVTGRGDIFGVDDHAIKIEVSGPGSSVFVDYEGFLTTGDDDGMEIQVDGGTAFVDPLSTIDIRFKGEIESNEDTIEIQGSSNTHATVHLEGKFSTVFLPRSLTPEQIQVGASKTPLTGIEINAERGIDLTLDGTLFAQDDGIALQAELGDINLDLDGDITLGYRPDELKETFSHYTDERLGGTFLGGLIGLTAADFAAARGDPDAFDELLDRLVTSEISGDTRPQDGIEVRQAGGDVTFDINGNILAGEDGIQILATGFDDPTDGTADLVGGNVAIMMKGKLVNELILPNREFSIGNRDDGYDITAIGDIGIHHQGLIDAGDDGYDLDFENIAGARTDAVYMIRHYGDVMAGANGYRLDFLGDADIQHLGNLTSGTDAIDVDTDGSVDVTFWGNIDAGDEAYQIEAGGPITVAHWGNIDTDSDGFKLNGLDESIDLTFGNGTLDVSANAVEIFTNAGVANTFTNFGNVLDSGNFTIATGDGDETVENNGIINGDVDLGGGTNAFNNNVGGLFNAGSTVNLGGGLLTNTGAYSPGGQNNILATTITGGFTQPGSSYDVDIDMVGLTQDFTLVTGPASIGGDIKATLTSVAAPTTNHLILSSNTSLTDTGAVAKDTAVVDFGLTFGPLSLTLQVLNVDFNIPGLNNNQRNLAGVLNSLVGGGNATAQKLLVKLANISSPSTYAMALSGLGPDAYVTTFDTTQKAHASFRDELNTCRNQPYESSRPNCFWSGGSGRHIEGGDEPDYDADIWSVSAGRQTALSESVRVGFGVGTTDVSTDAGYAGFTSGRLMHGGVFANVYDGPVTFGGILSGGFGDYEVNHGIPGLTMSEGDADTAFFDAQLNASYLAQIGGWFFQPMVNSGFAHISLDQEGPAEAGNTISDLVIDGAEESFFYAGANVGFHRTVSFGNTGAMMKFFGRTGVNYLGDYDPEVAAGFASIPGTGGLILSESDFDNVSGFASVGTTFFDRLGRQLTIEYDGQFGANSQSHAGKLLAKLPI